MTRRLDARSQSGGEDLDPIEEAVAGYLEQLDAGKTLDPGRILAEHPASGREILAGLEQFLELGGKFRAGGDLGSIGDYRLLKQVGRGGMGVVYEAWQSSMDRRVALKVLPAGIAADARAVARFIREARVAGRLQHSNIVSVFGTGVESNTPYYAMEFVEGETLAELLDRLRAPREKASEEERRGILSTISLLFRPGSRRERLPPDSPDPSSTTCAVVNDPARRDVEAPDLRVPQDHRAQAGVSGFHFGTDEVNLQYCLHVARAFARVAEGLQYAHDKGVIHRDLKPSNLILDEDGQLRILDFGLARLEGQDTLTQSGDFLGTPLYMSPEQALAQRIPLDHRTDIYSLGATLYEMLAWRPPFPGKDHQDTISQIIFRDPTPLRRLNPRIPRDLETIVLKCLRKDPRDRFSTAEALAQDLHRFVRGDPVEARPQPAWERVTRRAWRQKGRIAAMVVVCLLLLTSALLARKYLRDAGERNQDLYRQTVLGAMVKLELADQSKESPDRKPDSPEANDTRKRGLLKTALAGEAEADSDWSHRVKEAIEDLRRAAAILPLRPEAHYHLARGLKILGRSAEADQASSRAIECDRTFVPAWILREALRFEPGAGQTEARPPALMGVQGALAETWLDAHRAAKEKRWTQAGEAYGKLLDLEAPGRESWLGLSLEVRLGRGRSRLEAKDFDGALEDFAAVHALWPDLVEPALLLGKTYWLKGSRNRAVEVFEQLYRKAGSSDDAAFKIAELLGDLKEHELGLAWTDRLKDGARRGVQRSSFLLELNRLEEGIEAADSAIQIDGRLARAFYMRGRNRQKRGDLTGAIEDYTRALDNDPSHEEALFWRGTARAGISGRSHEALADLDKVIELNPAQYLAHTLRGSIRANHGDLEGGTGELEKAIDLDPKRVNALNRLIAFCDTRGELDRQIAALSRVIRANPGSLNLCRRRNILYGKRGDHRQAAAGAEELIALASEKTDGKMDGNGPFAAACDYALAAGLVRKDEARADREALERKYAGRAVELLGKALERGFKDYSLLRGETALDPIRGLPAFQDLVGRISERNRGEDPDLLAMVAEGLFSKKELRRAVRIFENALRLPNASQSLARRLDECRRSALPDLPSYGSIDWAVGTMEILVPEGAEWRFFRGRSRPSPGLEWTRLDFDDSSWEKGPSGFGYGDGDDATVLADMRYDYTTVYIRREVTLPDPANWHGLTLSVVADDGFVAYLNGKEVGRQRAGPPGVPLPFDFRFGGLAPDEPEAMEIALDSSILVSGRNVFAIQGVNHVYDSTDLSLIPVVKGEPLHGAERGGDLLARFRTVASGGDAPARVAYLEGTLLESAGKHREAASKFEEAHRLDGASLEPCLRLVGSLRAAGDPVQAEARVREALDGRIERDEVLWDLWFEVSAVDLNRPADEILASLPAPGWGSGARAADLRWLLEELLRSGAVRINSGGEDYVSPRGVLWGRDRFHSGGYRYFDDVSPYTYEPYSGEIKGTEDDVLYHTGRRFLRAGLRPPGYRIPVPRGRYRAVLHFAEIFDNAPAETMFEIKLEGKSLVKGYEPLFAGFRTADSRSFDLEVPDGFLDIELVHEFKDPVVSAIEVQKLEDASDVLPATGSTTPTAPRELAERHFLRGLAMDDKGDHGRAIASFSETLKIEPRHHWARWNRALAQCSRENWEGAIADFTETLKTGPTDARTHGLRGQARLQKGDLEGAMADAARALELDGKDIYAYSLRSECRLKKNDLDGVLADSEAALSIDPMCSWALFKRAYVLQQRDDLDGAIAAYTEALKVDPGEPSSYNNRGNARREKGDLDGALADYDQGLKVDPGMAVLYKNRAAVHLERDDLDGVIADLSQIIKLRPADAELYESRAVYHRRRGDLGGAISDLGRVIEIDPERAASARVARADLFKEQGDLDNALAEYDALAEIDPDDFLPMYHRGLLLIESGDTRGALEAVSAWLARRSGQVSSANLYNVACFYSRASAGVTAKELTDETKEASQRHAARALELLEQCLDQGEGLDIVRKDADFDPIRALPGYRAIFEKLSARRGRDPEILASLAEAQLLQGAAREGILNLERALRLPDAKQDLSGILDERRHALLPDLVSHASIDAALEVTEPLIPEDAEWRYFRGRSEPSVGLEWAGLDFDDSTWERGPGSFGYGSASHRTILTDMRGHYTSLYIRREFEVPDPDRLRSLTLSINADDGCVAYLNGEAVEWIRAGEPGVRVPFDAVSRGESDFTNETRVRIPVSALRRGKNVIAIQGLNRVKHCVGFGLRAALRAEPVLQIDEEKKRFDAFRRTARGDDATLRLAYLEGRILQRADRHAEAAARYEEILARDRTRPEPWLRLAECLRASGPPSRAEARLREALSSGLEDGEDLWDLWFAVSAVDLKRSAAEMTGALPGKLSADRGADMRWILEEISSRGAVRIRCGGEEYRSPSGKVWSRDRFFRGGKIWDSVAMDHFDGDVGDTQDDPLYLKERYFPADGSESDGYRVPLPRGLYRVTLHFAENANFGSNLRRFDVEIEGKRELLAYEPAAIGLATAEARRFEVRVEDGFLDVVFLRIDKDPKISALEIEDLSRN